MDVEALHARRADLDGRMTELAGLFAQGAVTGPQLAEGTRRLRTEAADLDAQIAAVSAHSPLSGFADAGDVAEAWKVATISRRKAVVDALMTVTLVKAPRGRPAGWRRPEDGGSRTYFNPRTVRVEWRKPDT